MTCSVLAARHRRHPACGVPRGLLFAGRDLGGRLRMRTRVLLAPGRYQLQLSKSERCCARAAAAWGEQTSSSWRMKGRQPAWYLPRTYLPWSPWLAA